MSVSKSPEASVHQSCINAPRETGPAATDAPCSPKLEEVTTAKVINATKGVEQDDIIVAFMGPTGSGKSFFIDLLTGVPDGFKRRAGNSLASVTQDIQATRVSSPRYPGKEIVLVDTPGFDDTTRTDMEILHMISDWLQATYRKRVKLSGLIYLHRITDNRMAGSPYKNLRMFGQLCGNLVMDQVILVTTMWERVDHVVGEMREGELRTVFWKPLIEAGSRVDRLNTATSGDAWDVIGTLVKKRMEEKKSEIVLLQEELVDRGVKLNETQAGKALYSDLQKVLAEQKESMKSLLAQVEKSNDPYLSRELRKEYERVQKEFDRTFDEARKLKLSFLKRLFSKFLTNKTTGKPVNLLTQGS